MDDIFYQLKNGYKWCALPNDLPPYSTVFWHYNLEAALGLYVLPGDPDLISHKIQALDPEDLADDIAPAISLVQFFTE